MFREFCFSRVQKMVLCASAYDKFLYDDLFFFFFIRMFSSFSFCVRWAECSNNDQWTCYCYLRKCDNIQNNVYDRYPFHLNCSTMFFRFIYTSLFALFTVFSFFRIFLQVSACQFVYLLISCFRPSECDLTMCSSVIERLPYEMIVKIFSYVPHDDLCGNVRLVCQRFNAVSYDASLWAEVSFPTLPLSLDQSLN
jgi:hypothetical protein